LKIIITLTVETISSKHFVIFRSLAAIRAQAKREIEAERAAALAAEEEPETSKPPPSPKQQDPERLAVTGIYFACPLIGNFLNTSF